MNIFTQFFKRFQGEVQQSSSLKQELMRREAELNRDIFGPVPKDVKREFFCLDRHTWVWYEEWTNVAGQRQNMTTKYLVRKNEILKSQNGGDYTRLNIEEAKNFQKAVKKYVARSKSELYAGQY